MANQDKAVLLAISGAIYRMPPEDRAKVEEAAAKLREVIAAGGNHGQVALALVGAEMAAAS